jgi:hypothetical protein
VSGADTEPAVYRIGLANGPGGVVAAVFDLPGCRAVARDEAEMRNILPVAIAEYLAWLDGHGEVTRNAFPFLFEITEEVDVSTLAGVAYGEFCFEDDLRPAERVDIEAGVRLMGYSHQDLLSIVRPLPDLVLDWQPPAYGVVSDPWAGEPRSIREILGHIASSEGYYARNLRGEREPPRDGHVRSDLFSQRQGVLARLHSLTDEDLRAQFKHEPMPEQQEYEHWTVRKALRRFIAHERFLPGRSSSGWPGSSSGHHRSKSPRRPGLSRKETELDGADVLRQGRGPVPAQG